jgi:hypothetical protein
VRRVLTLSEWKRRAGAKKDFEIEHPGVFAAPGSPLAHFLTAEFGLNPDSVVAADSMAKNKPSVANAVSA